MIYLFDKRDDLIGILTKSDIKSSIQIEEINGIERLDLEVNLSAKDKLKDVEYLAHKQVDEKDRFTHYKIIARANHNKSLTYTAINSAFDDFKGYGYIKERRMNKTTARLGLEAILHGSRWKVGYTEEGKVADFYMYDLTRLDALSKLVDTFNCEVKFRVTFDGNKITGRYVDLYQEIGEETHKRFFYGTNALEVVREEKQGDIFTAVIGRGKGEEKFDDEGNSTGGFGRKIDFKEVVWSKSKGDPVDKPKGQEYVEIKDLTEKFGYSDGSPRFKIITHDKIEDPNELLKACYQDLINGSRPLVQFKATLKDIGRVGLGDKVNIIRSDLDIFYTARIFKIQRNLLDPERSVVDLGDNLEFNQAKQDRKTANAIKDLDSRVTDIAGSAQETFVRVINQMRDEVENSYFNEDGYNYELKVGNKYNLPAGYYSFDRPIDQNPTKVIYVGAGKMLIANKKKADGSWDWKTMSTGDGVVAESIVGTLGEFAKVNATQINVNSDFYKTDIGKKIDTKIVGMGKDIDGKITALDQKTIEGLTLIDGKLVDETGKIYENLKEIDGNIVQLDEQISEKLEIVDGKIVDETGKIRDDLEIIDNKIVDETGKIRKDLKIVDGKIVEISEKVVLKGVLYNSVKITPEKGIQVLDNQSRERVQLGNWAPGRYGLNLKDATGNQTILDDQGILQSWQDGRCDNADSNNPLKLHVYIPDETSRIYKAALRIYTEGFRAYSKGTASGGGKPATTEGGSGGYPTTGSGGFDTRYTEQYKNVDGGMERVYTKTKDGEDYSRWIDLYVVRSHEHFFRIDDHVHSIDIRSHIHHVDLPDHFHDIVFGIYQEYASNVRMEVYINGNDRTSAVSGNSYIYGRNDELNLTKYLDTGWNEIEIRTNQRCRIDATIFIQALLNYGGY